MVFDRSLAEEDAHDTPGADDQQDAARIRQAASLIGSRSREQRRFLAGYTYVLMRLARADAEPNDAEIARIEESVMAAGGLTASEAALMVVVAGRTSSLYGTTEDYAVTREFARSASPQELQRLLRACVAMAVSDGPLTGGETAELYEIGRELGFRADEIDAVRDQVEPHDTEPGASPDLTDDR